MKTHSLLISFLMLLVIMGACSSGPVMRNATGFAYEIVVTMDKADWDAPAGNDWQHTQERNKNPH